MDIKQELAEHEQWEMVVVVVVVGGGVLVKVFYIWVPLELLKGLWRTLHRLLKKKYFSSYGLGSYKVWFFTFGTSLYFCVRSKMVHCAKHGGALQHQSQYHLTRWTPPVISGSPLWNLFLHIGTRSYFFSERKLIVNIITSWVISWHGFLKNHLSASLERTGENRESEWIFNRNALTLWYLSPSMWDSDGRKRL